MFKIIVLLSSLFLASCATVAPIVNSNSPINIYGVTTLPPQNGDWVVITASGYQSSLGSKGVNKNESQVVNVSIFQLPSLDSDKKFLEYIVSSRASAPNTGRFETKKIPKTFHYLMVLFVLNTIQYLKILMLIFKEAKPQCYLKVLAIIANILKKIQ